MAKKILIIEDDVFLGDVLVQKLRNDGYEASLARDGGLGLKMIGEIKPDLILLDIILPTMNGYEILEAKVKDHHIKDIPVIVISNSGQPVEISRVLELGVKDYLVKAQFSPNEVMIKVKEQLERNPLDTRTPLHEETHAPSVPLKGLKILWVEDDKFLSDLIARKFSAEGAILFHAMKGEDALKILETELPDVITLDILLPGINGFEILQKVKANPKTKNVPVVLLSNLGQKEEVDKGIKLGAAKFLIKATVTLDEIIAEIRKAVGEKKAVA